MNKWHGISVLVILFCNDLKLFRCSEACKTISHSQCVNSTYFLWCVDADNRSLVTIEDITPCPQNLVCDDTQVSGCVDASTVSNVMSTSIVTNAITENTSKKVETTDPTITVSDADFTCIYEVSTKPKTVQDFTSAIKLPGSSNITSQGAL